MSRDPLCRRPRRPLDAPSRAARWLAAAAVALTASGCASVGSYVQTEAAEWGAFGHVLGGDLAAGTSTLPAPVREGHCYRVILASAGQTGAQLAFMGPIDAQSVGFEIRPIERRSAPSGSETVSVFGFCSRGTGTVQLRATLPAAGYGALYEAPFGSLSPAAGQDVADASAWLAQHQRELAERRAREDQERRTAAVAQYIDSVRGEMRSLVGQLVDSRGRYPDVVFDEVGGAERTSESLVLEPGRCYVFAAVPHRTTGLEVDLSFARIRNAAARSDEGGGVTYTVCTAPRGPIQEVTFSVSASVGAGSPHPPAYAVRVAHRPQSSAERREADAEWLRNDPEGATP